MRISTNQIYVQGLNNMLNQQGKVAKLQDQLSSGKKIQTPADDPIAAAKIDLMKQRISTTERLQRNREAADSILSNEERTLANVVSALQRLRQLQIQGGDEGLSEDDRKSIAAEASIILGQIDSLSNTKDINGSYIFSGSNTGAQAFSRDAMGQYIYNGDDTRRYQPVTSSLDISLNDPGSDIFMRIKNGNGDFSVTQGAGNTGYAYSSAGSVIDKTAYVEDNYTIQIALNTAGEKVVMVTGAVSGNVIPPTGLPDDAPLYNEGDSVTFNGIEVILNGQPDVGDSFTIQPSVNESLFSTVQRVISNLQQSFTTLNDKAAVRTENEQLLEQLDSALDNVLRYQSDVGARLNQLDLADQLNSDIIETSRNTQSQLENVDLAQTATELNLQMIYLQAAQQSFVKIQGLTAFNYI